MVRASGPEGAEVLKAGHGFAGSKHFSHSGVYSFDSELKDLSPTSVVAALRFALPPLDDDIYCDQPTNKRQNWQRMLTVRSQPRG